MHVFTVEVPIESVAHETLESLVHAELPEAVLSNGMILKQQPDKGLVVELKVAAERPLAAKLEAVRQVELLLQVIAVDNIAFRVRIGAVTATREPEGASETPTALSTSGSSHRNVNDSIFLEEHVALLKHKGSLDWEDGAFKRLPELAATVQNCVALNLLLVTSDRPQVRWLLAVVGLEALAVGRLGPQETLNHQMNAATVRSVTAAVDAALLDAGVNTSLRERATKRVPETTVAPVAHHVRSYLDAVRVAAGSVHEIKSWWGIRSKIAHGSAITVDETQLNQLITVFQTALRAELEPDVKDA